MATFSQWLKLQEGRQDETGSAARYWAQVTPGRISGVTGIIRHLEKHLGELGTPGLAGNQALANAEAALAGIRSAVDEYGRDSIAEQARKAGVLALVPPAGPESDAEPPLAPGEVREYPPGTRTAVIGHAPGSPYAGRSAPGTVTRETPGPDRASGYWQGQREDDAADAAAARKARASIEAGEQIVPWEQVRAESRSRHPSEIVARSPTMEALARIEHKQDVLQESVNALLEAVNLLVSELPHRESPNPFSTVSALGEAARRESVAAIVERAFQNEDGSFDMLALWQAAQQVGSQQ
jgi:hypothetical protein